MIENMEMAVEVPAEKKDSFWPWLFGKFEVINSPMISAANSASFSYEMADFRAHSGIYYAVKPFAFSGWKMFALRDNKTGFIAPSTSDETPIVYEAHPKSAKLSPQAAGVACTLLAMFGVKNRADVAKDVTKEMSILARREEALRKWAVRHPEAEEINKVLEMTNSKCPILQRDSV